MPSKNARLPTSFGKFSKLDDDRVQRIKASARAAARAYKKGDERTYLEIIDIANKTLSKHETGVFSGFLMAEASPQ